MAEGTKVRLDSLEEQLARIQPVMGQLYDMVGADEEIQPVTLCKKYEDLHGQVFDLNHKFGLVISEVQKLTEEVHFLKDTGQTYPGAQEVGPRVKILEPTPFNGVQRAKTLENFLWDVTNTSKPPRSLKSSKSR